MTPDFAFLAGVDSAAVVSFVADFFTARLRVFFGSSAITIKSFSSALRRYSC
jgi:hypothetical protein